MKEFVSALLTETRFQLDRLRETTLTNPLTLYLTLIHISSPRDLSTSRMPSSA